MIGVEQIATNRYAPAGSEAINMYSNGLEGGDHLTIGQLAIAVSMRAAAEYEAQSVLKMNRMTNGSEKLSTCSRYMEGVADGTAKWAEVKAYLTNVLGVKDGLPDNIDTYAKRMTVVALIKAKVDAMTQVQQEEMIDLQTLVNRRDVAFSAFRLAANHQRAGQPRIPQRHSPHAARLLDRDFPPPAQRTAWLRGDDILCGL